MYDYVKINNAIKITMELYENVLNRSHINVDTERKLDIINLEIQFAFDFSPVRS